MKTLRIENISYANEIQIQIRRRRIVSLRSKIETTAFNFNDALSREAFRETLFIFFFSAEMSKQQITYPVVQVIGPYALSARELTNKSQTPFSGETPSFGFEANENGTHPEHEYH